MPLFFSIALLSTITLKAFSAAPSVHCFELNLNDRIPSFAGPIRVIRDIVTGAPLRHRRFKEDWEEIARREIQREFLHGRSIDDVNPIVVFRRVSRQFYWDNMEVVKFRREHYGIPLIGDWALVFPVRTEVNGETQKAALKIIKDIDSRIAIQQVMRVRRSEAYAYILSQDYGVNSYLVENLVKVLGKANVRTDSHQQIIIRRR